jgi:hypothetical protein
MLLMQQALLSAPKAAFLLCPGGFTLMNTPPNAFAAFESHLDACSVCAEERVRLLLAGEKDGAPQHRKTSGQGRKFAVAAAAVVLLAGTGYLVRRHFTDAPPHPPASIAKADRVYAEDPRFKDIAQPVALIDRKWFESVQPKYRDNFKNLVYLFETGHTARAVVDASYIADADPSVAMLYAVGLYEQRDVDAGYHAMLRAEAATPRHPFRCWTLLQYAFYVGDLDTAAREVDHLQAYPDYAKKAKDLLDKARKR